MQIGFKNKSVNNDVSKTRRRSLYSPPTWQNIARTEKNPTSSLNVSEVPQKYSENLYTHRRNYGVNGADGNSGSQTGLRGFGNRRSMSLVYKDVNGILLEEDLLLRDGELAGDDMPSIDASFGVKHSLDDITWSRYWHDARNRTYIRDRLLSNEPIAHREEFREGKLTCDEVDSNNNKPKSNNGESENSDENLSNPVNQLSLEERLEKIERDSGLAGSRDDTKRKMLVRKTSSIN